MPARTRTVNFFASTASSTAPPLHVVEIRVPQGRIYYEAPSNHPIEDENGTLSIQNGCTCITCLATRRRVARATTAIISHSSRTPNTGHSLPSSLTWHCGYCDDAHDYGLTICRHCGVCLPHCCCRSCSECGVVIPTGHCGDDRVCRTCSTASITHDLDPDARVGRPSVRAAPVAPPSNEWLDFSHRNQGRMRLPRPRREQPLLTTYGRGLTSSRVEHRSFPSRRTIGAEIEVCGTRHNDGCYASLGSVLDFWGAFTHGDGSLPSSGLEIVTVPAQGHYYTRQIIDICDALKQDGAWVDRRAGLHIHVGLYDARCGDGADGHRRHVPSCDCYSWADLRRLILLWEMVEPALYYMVNVDRRNNSYCVPVGSSLADLVRAHTDPTAFKVAIQEKYWRFRRRSLEEQRGSTPMYLFCDRCHWPLAPLPPELAWHPGEPCSDGKGTKIRRYLEVVLKGKRAKCQRQGCGWTHGTGSYDGRTWAGKKSDKGGANRYLSMNFHSWVHRGTVECRMHEGTVDAEEILRWSRLLARICDTAMRRTEKSILAEAARLTDTLSRFPALMGIAAESRDRAFLDWVGQRLEMNKQAAIAPPVGLAGLRCPYCGATGRVRRIEASVNSDFTDWCLCNGCGHRLYYNAHTGATRGA